MPHLAGTNDAALEYSVEPDPATGETLGPAAVAARVKARLSAAHLHADVEATGTGAEGRAGAGADGAARPGVQVRVVIDADLEATVDTLMRWRGGLTAYLAGDPAKTPIVQLGVGPAAISAIEPVERGKALALSLGPEARASLAKERELHPEEHIALALGHRVLATMPIADVLATPLVLRFGDDVTAYTRAHRTRLLLRSPVLPPMHRLSVARLPSRWGLATACVVLPFALSFAWLSFVRRFDRARPEPAWLVAVTFALGALSTLPAVLGEIGFAKLSPWLDPEVATLGGQAWALPLSIAVFALTVGVVEEGGKFLAAWSLASHRREFDEPIDGIIYGCAAALGFAAVENVKYFALGRMSGVIIPVRAFMSVPGHMFFGALWGYAMGRKLVSRRTSVIAFFALAALAHGTFDALLSTDGFQLVATLLMLALAVAFVATLRSALRHGAVSSAARTRREQEPPPTRPMPVSTPPRAYFRVGTPAAFYGCAAGMVACAIALTALGGVYELHHHRAGVVFVVVATTLLGLFGLAAYGASATIPLDVAIDAQGVTFAGACTAWAAIVGFDAEVTGSRAVLRLQTREGIIRMGPASRHTAQAMIALLRAVMNDAVMPRGVTP
jgi:RsiW-degrading membrane proteinase PrsW (M82 family)